MIFCSRGEREKGKKGEGGEEREYGTKEDLSREIAKRKRGRGGEKKGSKNAHRFVMNRFAMNRDFIGFN